MTVEELITKLETIKDKTKTVLVVSDNFEIQGNKIEASFIYLLSGKMERKDFRDAFDGESYSKSVFSYKTDGEEFVIIS
jgi:hypothetical protein